MAGDGPDQAGAGGDEPAAPKRRRKRRSAASAAGGGSRRAAASDDGAARRVDERAPRARGTRPLPRSPAALAALLLFAWGQSLLAFEWARVHAFEPRGASHLVLVLAPFAAAVLAALGAVAARRAGRASLGGPLVRGLGLASGLLAFTAIVLSAVVAPRLVEASESARVVQAAHRLEQVALAIERHARDAGTYPTTSTTDGLASVLSPTWLPPEATLRDPWGHDLEYRSLSDGRGYVILSTGRDGELDLPIASYVDDPARVLQGNDIAVMNGQLLASGSALRVAPRPAPDADGTPRAERP